MHCVDPKLPFKSVFIDFRFFQISPLENVYGTSRDADRQTDGETETHTHMSDNKNRL